MIEGPQGSKSGLGTWRHLSEDKWMHFKRSMGASQQERKNTPGREYHKRGSEEWPSRRIAVSTPRAQLQADNNVATRHPWHFLSSLSLRSCALLPAWDFPMDASLGTVSTQFFHHKPNSFYILPCLQYDATIPQAAWDRSKDSSLSPLPTHNRPTSSLYNPSCINSTSKPWLGPTNSFSPPLPTLWSIAPPTDFLE